MKEKNFVSSSVKWDWLFITTNTINTGFCWHHWHRHFTLEYAGPAAPCSWAKNADGWGLVHNPALNGKPNSCIDTGLWASVPFQNLIHFPRSAFLQQVHVSHPRGELIQSHLVNTASLAVSLYSLLSLRLSLLHSNYSIDAVTDILLRQACFRTGAISSGKHMFVLFKWNWKVSLHRKHKRSAWAGICKLWKTAHQVRKSLTWVFALWWRRPRLPRDVKGMMHHKNGGQGR